MSRNLAGPTLAVAAAALVAALLAGGGAWLRVAVAVPFALVLPGLALTGAAFPAGRLATAERLLLSLGLSLAVIVLGGLLLNLTPWGLRVGSWAVLLSLTTAVAGGIGLARRRRQPAAVGTPGGRSLGWAQIALCGLAVLVLAGAMGLTVHGAQGQATVGFTQLWMTQGEGGGAANLGLSNREPATTEFRLQFEVDGRVRRSWTLSLAPGETWTQAVPLPSDLPQTATIEGVLYRGDAPSVVYRRVKLQRGQQ